MGNGMGNGTGGDEAGALEGVAPEDRVGFVAASLLHGMRTVVPYWQDLARSRVRDLQADAGASPAPARDIELPHGLDPEAVEEALRMAGTAPATAESVLTLVSTVMDSAPVGLDAAQMRELRHVLIDSVLEDVASLGAYPAGRQGEPKAR